MAPVYDKDGGSVYQRNDWYVKDGGLAYPVQRAYVKVGGSLYQYFGGGGLLYVSDNTANYLRVYDLLGNRQSGDDISLGAGSWAGVAVAPTRLYVAGVFVLPTLRAYDFSGNRQAGDDIDPGVGQWAGMTSTPTRLYALDNTTNHIRAWDFQGNRQAGDDIGGVATGVGIVATQTRLYVLNVATNRLLAYDFSGNRHVGDEISLGAGGWKGVTVSPDHFYVLDNTDNYLRAWDLSWQQAGRE